MVAHLLGDPLGSPARPSSPRTGLASHTHEQVDPADGGSAPKLWMVRSRACPGDVTVAKDHQGRVARPGGLGARDKVAEKGSGLNEASGSSARRRGAARGARPAGCPGKRGPGPTRRRCRRYARKMAKVDSSTSVTTPPAESTVATFRHRSKGWPLGRIVPTTAWVRQSGATRPGRCRKSPSFKCDPEGRISTVPTRRATHTPSSRSSTCTSRSTAPRS